MEAAIGGDLFDFISSGPFPENIARMYFKKLITGI
jgi:hypothetical protein